MNNSADAETRVVPFRQEFALRNGETTAVGNDGLTVRFERVTSDERCPVGNECPEPGDAVLTVVIQEPSKEAAAVQLHSDPAKGSEAPFGRYRIRLVKLDPRPVGEQPVPLPRYTATFVITN